MLPLSTALGSISLVGNQASVNAPPSQDSFNFTNFGFFRIITPPWATRLRFILAGASGGTGNNGVPGGNGSIVTGAINVSPGDHIWGAPAQMGVSGGTAWGASGGGMSMLFQNMTLQAIAAGGGGVGGASGGYYPFQGGHGGGLVGQSGSVQNVAIGTPSGVMTAPTGGTQTSGGIGGSWTMNAFRVAGNGGKFHGGNASTSVVTGASVGGFPGGGLGGLGVNNAWWGGGGGGAGYYGGGGADASEGVACHTSGASGAGGSDFLSTSVMGGNMRQGGNEVYSNGFVKLYFLNF